MIFIINSMKNEANSFYLPFKLLEPYFEKHCASKNNFKIALIVQSCALQVAFQENTFYFKIWLQICVTWNIETEVS